MKLSIRLSDYIWKYNVIFKPGMHIVRIYMDRGVQLMIGHRLEVCRVCSSNAKVHICLQGNRHREGVGQEYSKLL